MVHLYEKRRDLFGNGLSLPFVMEVVDIANYAKTVLRKYLEHLKKYRKGTSQDYI